MIAEGSKEFLLGDSRYRYDPDHYPIAALQMPSISQILGSHAGAALSQPSDGSQPFLRRICDRGCGQGSLPGSADARAMDVSRLDGNLLDAVVRLAAAHTPAEVPVLMPLIQREIVYRLLMGQQRARLRHLQPRAATPRISPERSSADPAGYHQPLRIEDLARELLGMSVSGVHHRFKAVTAMSPSVPEAAAVTGSPPSGC